MACADCLEKWLSGDLVTTVTLAMRRVSHEPSHGCGVMAMRLNVHRAIWPVTTPLRINGHIFDCADTVRVELAQGEHVGRGEGIGCFYLGESGESLIDEIEEYRTDIEKGLSLADLQEVLPPGGARNAIDCALWDLKTKQERKSVWQLTGITPKPRLTVCTIGILETPELMARAAAQAEAYPILKVKLNGDAPVERMEAVRAARPDAQLVVDANQGFTFDLLNEVLEPFRAMGISMIEQPLRRGEDSQLASFQSPIPICADESCLHRDDLPAALERYDMINIKLDKAGGLTEALMLARQTKAAGKKLMVGNMGGTSLSMAPAFVIAQMCDLVDLDGPFILKSDCLVPMIYEGASIDWPAQGLWGGAW